MSADGLNKPRRYATALCALVMFAVAMDMGYVYFFKHTSVAGLVISILSLWLSYGLLKDNRFARRTMAALCLLTAFALPLGLLNPMAVGDYLSQGAEPPTVAGTLIRVIPADLLLLVLAYLVDPLKAKLAALAPNT